MNLARAVLVLCLLLGGVAQAQCVPEFRPRDGWLGGDNALAVVTAPGRSVWLFSDTFVGPHAATSRTGAMIVPNTVARARCAGGHWVVRYYWRHAPRGLPLPIFAARRPGTKLWPTAAFAVHGTLYVLLHEVAPRPEAPPDELFNFRLSGTLLASMPHFAELTPDRWRPRYVRWPDLFDPNEWNGGTAVHDGYLYCFVGRSTGRYRLLRLPLGQLEHPVRHLQYLDASGHWQAGDGARGAMVVVYGSAGGSVQFDTRRQEWRMVFGPEFLGRAIVVRTARRIEGPWSDPLVALSLPDMQPGQPRFDPHIFCYAGREQPADLLPGADRLLSYDCNTSRFDLLVQDMSLYFPRFHLIPRAPPTKGLAPGW